MFEKCLFKRLWDKNNALLQIKSLGHYSDGVHYSEYLKQTFWKLLNNVRALMNTVSERVTCVTSCLLSGEIHLTGHITQTLRFSNKPHKTNDLYHKVKGDITHTHTHPSQYKWAFNVSAQSGYGPFSLHSQVWEIFKKHPKMFSLH